MDLLQTPITSALCQTVCRRVRRTERQRAWTLQALVQFWTAVILRAPEALSQALVDTVDQREPMFPRIVATPRGVLLTLAHLGLPGVRDGPPPPPAVSAARAEQRALPYVTR
jgi:hypothetical protein